jgi:hypothetical protein
VRVGQRVQPSNAHENRRLGKAVKVKPVGAWTWEPTSARPCPYRLQHQIYAVNRPHSLLRIGLRTRAPWPCGWRSLPMPGHRRCGRPVCGDEDPNPAPALYGRPGAAARRVEGRGTSAASSGSQSAGACWNGRRALPSSPSIGSSCPIAVLRLPGLCSWSYQFLSGSRRTIAPHHHNPAEADWRWRGRGASSRLVSIGPLLATTHALFADDVERNVSNPLARFGAG